MPTSSIFNSVIIDTPEKAEQFGKALEEAEKFARNHPPVSVPECRELTGEEIKKFFEK